MKENSQINVVAVRQDEKARLRSERQTKHKLSRQEALVSANSRKVRAHGPGRCGRGAMPLSHVG